MPTYKINMARTVVEYASVEVNAESEESARRAAFYGSDGEKWEPTEPNDFEITSVTKISEGE